jgi:hypothetical protein
VEFARELGAIGGTGQLRLRGGGRRAWRHDRDDAGIGLAGRPLARLLQQRANTEPAQNRNNHQRFVQGAAPCR